MKIKHDIGLPVNLYRVASLCIHPSVAQYNGFFTIDGYMNNYPLEYKHQFREIIEDEIEKDDTIKAYFDEWGSRCYLMSTEAFGFDFNKDNQRTIKNLSINTGVLTSMNCKYILAAVPIDNYSELGLTHLGTYSHVRSVWRIQLYQVF